MPFIFGKLMSITARLGWSAGISRSASSAEPKAPNSRRRASVRISAARFYRNARLSSRITTPAFMSAPPSLAAAR